MSETFTNVLINDIDTKMNKHSSESLSESLLIDDLHTEWRTNLFQYDSESFMMSLLNPCHIYAFSMGKFRYNCIFYSLFTIYLLYYSSVGSFIYFLSIRCPKTEVNQCYFLKENECKKQYTTINNNHHSCIYLKEMDLCVYDSTSTCLDKSEETMTMVITLLFMFMLWCNIVIAHYYLRTDRKNLHHIKKNNLQDICISIFCRICSNSQIYRETEYTESITV